MADPVVHITNGVPDSGTGNITTLGQTLTDGANATLGATTDVAVTAGAAGSMNAHLRSISRDIAGGIVLQPGSNVIGAVTQSGGPWSISGTVAATQSGTWTVQQGGAPWTMKPDGTAWALTGTSANVNLTNASVAVTGTFWQSTQPVSIAAAVTVQQATAANLNATVTGTVAATQSGNWTSRIVGNAGANLDFAGQNASGTINAELVGGQYNLSPASISSGNFSPLQLDSVGNLRVTINNANASVAVTQSGAWNVGQVGTWTVQPGNTQNTTPWLTRQTQTAAANGLTASRVVAAASTNATSLKASAGNIAAIDLFNVASYMVFLKLYNKASAPTVGTDTPVWTIPISPSGGFSIVFNEGEYFSTGIAYAITRLQADSDTTALNAGDVTGRIKWV